MAVRLLPEGGIIGKYDTVIIDIESERKVAFIRGKAIHKLSPDFRYAIMVYEKDIKCCELATNIETRIAIFD